MADRAPEPACKDCRHWRTQKWTNPKMDAEAIQAGLKNGQCTNTKSIHGITGGNFSCAHFERR